VIFIKFFFKLVTVKAKQCRGVHLVGHDAVSLDFGFLQQKQATYRAVLKRDCLCTNTNVGV